MKEPPQSGMVLLDQLNISKIATFWKRVPLSKPSLGSFQLQRRQYLKFWEPLNRNMIGLGEFGGMAFSLFHCQIL